MRAADAVTVLRNITYRPGWNITGDVMPEWERERTGDTVRITFTVDTVDTDRDCAQRNFDTPKRIEVAYGFNADAAESKSDLLAMVFAMIMEFELHENREFFRDRLDGTNAPFHPHRPEGQALWGAYFG